MSSTQAKFGIVLCALLAAVSAFPVKHHAEHIQCRPLGERCAGAHGKFIQWIRCCGQYPAVDCVAHPDADKDEDKWGRFCLEVTASVKSTVPTTSVYGTNAPRIYSTAATADLETPKYSEPIPPMKKVPSMDTDDAPAYPTMTTDAPTTAIATPEMTKAAPETATSVPEMTAPSVSSSGSVATSGPVPAAVGALEQTGLATYAAVEKEILIPDEYTADASAHVVDGKVVVWMSHDIEVPHTTANDESKFDMKDYKMMSFSEDMSKVTDHGNILNIDTVPWAEKMMWAPDATCMEGKCYVYFPAKDSEGVFRIGVAVSDSAYGPYKAQPEPIPGSFSIDPAVFVDDDGSAYLYFGGDWGGQLQMWVSGEYDPSAQRPTSGKALKPRVAKLSGDMLTFDGEVEGMSIVDESGEELEAMDQQRRFFEGAWVHKYDGTYYMSYSTGETHKIVYATSSSPTGPWTYQAEILSPPEGWTSHHSIVEATDGNWYLFYHDSKKSGQTSLRNVKMQKLSYREDGSIVPMSP